MLLCELLHVQWVSGSSDNTERPPAVQVLPEKCSPNLQYKDCTQFYVIGTASSVLNRQCPVQRVLVGEVPRHSKVATFIVIDNRVMCATCKWLLNVSDMLQVLYCMYLWWMYGCAPPGSGYTTTGQQQRRWVCMSVPGKAAKMDTKRMFSWGTPWSYTQTRDREWNTQTNKR